MGNANGREEGGGGIGRDDDDSLSGRRSNGESGVGYNHAPNSHPPGRLASSDSMGNNTPPQSPGRSRSPILFAPQVLSIFPFFHNIYLFVAMYIHAHNAHWACECINLNEIFFFLCFHWIWKYL
jgi:hypothetical protein